MELQERQYALAFMVHFIEDLHQPLHGGFASDQDGNAIRGAFTTATTAYAATNLHAMWDTTIIDTRIRRDFNGLPDLYYRYLLLTLATTYNESVSAVAGSARRRHRHRTNYYACSDDWSQESARLACSSAYTMPNGDRFSIAGGLTPVSASSGVGEAYYQQVIPVIELRILQAGVRLANVLNSIAAGDTSGGNSGGGGGGGGDGSGGVSSGAAGFMVFLIVMLILMQLVFCGLYYRKEKMGLSGLFVRGNGGGGSMGLIGRWW